MLQVSHEKKKHESQWHQFKTLIHSNQPKAKTNYQERQLMTVLIVSERLVTLYAHSHAHAHVTPLAASVTIMSDTPGNRDLAVSTHTQHDRKWFNSSYLLLFSSADSLMTGDSIARLRLPFLAPICHTTLYNHIQLILDWILGSQQSAVTVIVFSPPRGKWLSQDHVLHKWRCGRLSTIQASDVFPCACRWELASCPFDSRVRHRWGIYCSHHNIVGVSIHALSLSAVILSIANKSRL